MYSSSAAELNGGQLLFGEEAGEVSSILVQLGWSQCKGFEWSRAGFDTFATHYSTGTTLIHGLILQYIS